MGLVILSLTNTRRCPKSHVALAKNIVSDFEAMPEAPDGILENLPLATCVEQIAPGDMIQCRNNAPLAQFCWQLLRRGLKIIISGRDIGQGLVALIKRLKAYDVPNLIEKLEKYRGKELEKADKKRNAESASATINDKVDTIIAMTEDTDSVDELISKIESIFADVDEAGIPKAAVLLTTTHRAKGLEAENVWILEPNLYPSKWAKQEWEIKAERNLQYVMQTRSKNRLVFIISEKQGK